MKLLPLLATAGLLILTACSNLKQDTATGQHPAHFDAVITRHVSLDYLAYVPPEAATEPGKKWPTIVFLHGSGERGTNVWDVTKHGPPKLIKEAQDLKFVVLSPQCPPGEGWSADAVYAFVQDMKKRYPIDDDRVYLTGLSMGGSGTWATVLAHPEVFAAAVPICGRGDTNALPFMKPEHIDAIKRVPIWAFHGAKDTEVPVKGSKEIVAELEKRGANVKLTIYPDAPHDSWTQTYANPEVFAWMLAHDRSARTK